MGNADTHIHSKYSFDSKMKIQEIIDACEKNKIDYVAITDHVEFSNQPINEVIHRITNRNKKIDELQETTNVKILKGIEISEPHLYINETKELESIEDLDVILGSIHHVLGMPIRKMTSYKELYNLYLKSMLTMVEKTNINTLAHLDYIKRYISTTNFDEQLLNEILKTIIDRKIALEINTSGLRRCGQQFPSFEILDKYKQLGGNRICLGSDAHEVNEIYYGIDDIKDKINDYGFKEGIVVRKRFKNIK